MATLNYSILAVAVTLFAICIFAAAGFWLYRNRARQLSGTFQSEEQVDNRHLATSEDLLKELGCIIPLLELPGGHQAAELPATTSLNHHGDTSRQENGEVHALSFV
jgi:hypothetical protein